MKETLEYKILKYLSENDNGKYIKVSNISEDKLLLKSKIKNLTEDNFIYSKNTYLKIKIGNVNSSNEIQMPVCKIQSKGIEYLKNLDKKTESNITNNFNGSTIGQLNQESNFSNSPITNNTTQNPKSELKINSPILKFWKLISENKLISSLILALILFVIKKSFNIEL